MILICFVVIQIYIKQFLHAGLDFIIFFLQTKCQTKTCVSVITAIYVMLQKDTYENESIPFKSVIYF